jgi:hypothetical protein
MKVEENKHNHFLPASIKMFSHFLQFVISYVFSLSLSISVLPLAREKFFVLRLSYTLEVAAAE